jgi:hypothetical protein
MLTNATTRQDCLPHALDVWRFRRPTPRDWVWANSDLKSAKFHPRFGATVTSLRDHRHNAHGLFGSNNRRCAINPTQLIDIPVQMARSMILSFGNSLKGAKSKERKGWKIFQTHSRLSVRNNPRESRIVLEHMGLIEKMRNGDVMTV